MAPTPQKSLIGKRIIVSIPRQTTTVGSQGTCQAMCKNGTQCINRVADGRHKYCNLHSSKR